MEDADSVAGPPGANATPLQPITPDRANQQNPMVASLRGSVQRDSDVHDKIRQFNNMSHLPPNAASMSKQLERMTADAALKRAMIGREEAETEMRRYREEARSLRRQVEEGRERERKVGERLETVMENYGRAKETYSHTQALWEKEIRRARKETFKSQSTILKLQEELKSARAATKSAEECLEREKELSQAREQEAFAARYQLVELQQQLDSALERVKFLEEERDAFKAAAKSEEIARIAAEGRLPLPPEDPDSEFASPKKSFQGRESLSTFEIVSSAATEAEIEELTRLWQWEKQRADRTQDHLEFVQAELELRRSQPKSRRSTPRRSIMSPGRKERTGPIEIVDPSDLMILGRDTKPSEPAPSAETTQPEAEEEPEFTSEPQVIEPAISDAQEEPEEQPRQREKRESRRGTIFVPAEGIFRTLSQQELEAMQQDEGEEEATLEPPTPSADAQPDPPRYARTPSVEPPSFALLAQERTSLLSLLNAPRESEANLAFQIPSRSGDASSYALEDEEEEASAGAETRRESPGSAESPGTRTEEEEEEEEPPSPASDARPHTSAAFYRVTTTTTTVPIQDEKAKRQQQQQQQAPLTTTTTTTTALKHGRTPSFDVNNPALTPTMTREQALAQIRERRGRARSAMQGAAAAAATPRRQMLAGVAVADRNVSAPAGRAAKGRS